MQIECGHCKGKFRLADQKVRPGQRVTVKCPRCRNSIEISTSPEVAARAPEPSRSYGSVAEEVDSGAYDQTEKPFGYVETGVQSALVCEHDLVVKDRIRAVLERLNYYPVEADLARNALKFMRYHSYNLIVLNEAFEATDAASNHVLQYLAKLPMNARRDTFVLLIGDNVRTKDRMMAYNLSVNLVVNVNDMDKLEKLLHGDLAEHEEFYRVFKESLRKVGRA